MNSDLKSHWENIYSSKNEDGVSWFQEYPKTSIDLIEKYSSNKSISIVDIGSGRSRILKNLIENEYDDLTYLDISQEACSKSKISLGNNKDLVQWYVVNVLDFNTEYNFSIWHDRAVFHFIISKEDVEKYKQVALHNIVEGGYLILGTFSENGPEKCSGLNVSRYSPESLKKIFNPEFKMIESFTIDHKTPFDTNQNFLFSIFKK
ncbi:MAG: SAM-dependent methyltransferase [Bacteroidota bacterium]|nr:SAM-dependent methyltransferase [Bacteroidota bacterium]